MAEINIDPNKSHGKQGQWNSMTVRKITQTDDQGHETQGFTIYVGKDRINIYPAKPVEIRELAQSLLKVADQLESSK